MSDTLKKHVGKRIRAARKGVGFTQEQLAVLIEKSVETVSNLERGHTAPSLETLDHVARALNLPVEWFVSGHRISKGSERSGILRAELEIMIAGLDERELIQLSEIARVIRNLGNTSG